jgi:Fe(3+) dicitrate transport protein
MGISMLLILLLSDVSYAQMGKIRGIITDQEGKSLAGATAFLDAKNSSTADGSGKYEIKNLPYGNHVITFFFDGKETLVQAVELNQTDLEVNIRMTSLAQTLEGVTVTYTKEKGFGRSALAAVENFGIYQGKKTEVITLSEITGNTATNNARQIYSKITGLNIWESDGAGLQLGIGGRGLSPNRTANFNVRQNGYDISADALGYPESYYTPPLEAIDRIELVRGAASLQYGTQFGGMLNFKFKKGPKDRPFEWNTRQTIGSWGYFNTFNSIGGTSNNGKLNYYAFHQYKRGDGYRENSGFSAQTGFLALEYQATNQLKLGLEWTKMSYLAQQPGGLTDRNFEQDPRQSFRNRNWFEVDWNLAALTANYSFSEKTQINTRTFGLLAGRDALGNLERINVIDFGQNRTLIRGDFKNIGNETRLLHSYEVGDLPQTLLVGSRVYVGTTTALQGDANNGSGPDFEYLNPSDLENSDYLFQNRNTSVFLENIINLTEKWSLVPGIRFEHIYTSSEGYFKQRVFDGAGNLIVENRTDESMGRSRNFFIFGLGTNYKINESWTLYGNFSQNYRAINFSDIRVVNPNFRVDPNIQDETGFTADLGLKLKKGKFFQLEMTAFWIRYDNKIGQVLRADQPPLFLDYRYRGNISTANNIGLEFFGEVNILPLFGKTTDEKSLSFFVNTAFVDARYTNTDDTSIRNKKVEMVPPFTIRAGSQWTHGALRASLQFSHLTEHFSDATNARFSATAVEGVIPSYSVADLSFSYRFGRFTIEGSINNLLNQRYFTRRAEGYPGPGIIPADGRGFFLTLAARF